MKLFRFGVDIFSKTSLVERLLVDSYSHSTLNNFHIQDSYNVIFSSIEILICLMIVQDKT